MAFFLTNHATPSELRCWTALVNQDFQRLRFGADWLSTSDGASQQVTQVSENRFSIDGRAHTLAHSGVERPGYMRAPQTR